MAQENMGDKGLAPAVTRWRPNAGSCYHAWRPGYKPLTSSPWQTSTLVPEERQAPAKGHPRRGKQAGSKTSPARFQGNSKAPETWKQVSPPCWVRSELALHRGRRWTPLLQEADSLSQVQRRAQVTRKGAMVSVHGERWACCVEGRRRGGEG